MATLKTKNRMKKNRFSEIIEWQQFEKMITRLEKSLSPESVIKKNDKLIDRITGTLREVDASIRQKIGSSEILIILECRKRNKRADTLWIEQLKSKKEDIGADKVLAVSSIGFTKSALIKAQRYGIAVRTTEMVDATTVNSWGGVTQFAFRYDPINFDVHCNVPQEIHNQFHFELRDVQKPHILDASICQNIYGKKILLRDLLEYVLENLRHILKSAMNENDEETFTIDLDYTSPSIFLSLPCGTFNIIKISCTLKFSEYSEEELEPFQGFIYSDGEKPIINTAEFKLIESPGVPKDSIVTMHHEVDINRTFFTVHYEVS
jgi:hypothetical protein